MCIAFLAWRCRPDLPLIIAANRDEFYLRPTQPMQPWPDNPNILAGQDLQAGGTWLALNKNGRFALITNYREPGESRQDAPSRGSLVSDFVEGNRSPFQYGEVLQRIGNHYNGFNLVFGDPAEIYYYSNKTNKFRLIPPGIHGLSNHLLNTPWPKVSRGRKRLAELLNWPQIVPANLFAILADSLPAADEQLPKTGLSQDQERLLSSIFIKGPGYGTRCGTVALFQKDGTVSLEERTYLGGPDQFDTRNFSFKLPVH